MDKNAMSSLYDVVLDRKEHSLGELEKSYTCYLFNEGLDKILKKCGEECAETIIAAKNGEKEHIKNEICDFLYHLIVLMAETGVSWYEVENVLFERSRKIGNLKTFKDVDKDS